MIAILQDRRSGEIAPYEVPVPELRPGGILVKTAYSVISAGTERKSVATSEKSLIGKALARPDLVKKVIQYAKDFGVKAAYDQVQSKLDSLNALGYSCAGTVIGVGDRVTEFRVGDRVACAGGSYASHCGVNFVPKNLAVHVPDGVPLDQAALSTIGAVAMQGLRQAGISFGETIVVIGAGLIGVLAIQMARAAGCRVVAIDTDPVRVARARVLGANLAMESAAPDLEQVIAGYSRYGADAVIITAGTASNEPIELSARLARDRAKIVIVGAVGMDVDREHVYHKELSILLSRSYGPGRYDDDFELHGKDYPIGYVRWTEQRNLEAFLDLLSSGSLNVAPLIGNRFPAVEGARAYAALKDGSIYTALIDYSTAMEKKPSVAECGAVARPIDGQLRIGCLGAGGFARGIILPNLRSIPSVLFQSVATASGVAAESARKGFGFAQAQTTDELIRNPSVDAIFVLSRHDSHASYVERAMSAGKPVFVEKPLATTREQLARVQAAFCESASTSKPPFVMVGFNRRFAPATQELRTFFQDRREPMILNVEVNAGYLPLSHWVHEEGGRIIGEGCHFVDWARYVVGLPIITVSGFALPDGTRYHGDNVSATLRFQDGSLAQIKYFANGDRSLPKERYEVVCDGSVARIEEMNKLELVRQGRSKTHKYPAEKGHKREMESTIAAMRSGGPAPIPWAELVEVTEATLAIVESVASGYPVSLSERGTVAQPTGQLVPGL